MKFLYPEFLWAFAVLLIPIVIHLFNFKRYKTLYFSSLQFVKEVDQKTKSVQQLKHYLILATRLLAFSFLVLAFAQPYFSTSGPIKSSTPVMLYIDNSFSMQAQGVEGELLSEARQAAKTLIKNAPRGTQFIIGTNELSGIEQRKLSTVEALEKIDNIKYSPLVRSLDEITNWQVEALKKNGLSDSTTTIKNILLSDFQKNEESKTNEIELNQFSVHPMQLVPVKVGNLAIDSIWFGSPIRRVSTTNEIFIRIVNNSDNDIQNVEVNVQIGSLNKSFYTDVPANQKKITSITYTDQTTGYKSGYISITDDHIHFDDTYYLSYEVKEKSSILVLNGEDAIPNIGIALELEPFYEVKETPITAITSDDFIQRDLVILNGANAIPSGIRNYLTEFQEGGGSLALFPGKSAIKEEWNSLLTQLKLPHLGNPISAGTRLRSLNKNDEFITEILDGKTEKLNLPGVIKAYQPIQANNTNFIPLIELQNGLPIFGYSKGKAKSFMFYSSIHPDWGNISKDALFPILLLRISELSKRKAPLSLTIGESTLYPVEFSKQSKSAIHLTNQEFDFIPSVVEKFGIVYISIDQSINFEQLQAGNYSIKNDQNLGELSINYNRNESKLDYYSDAEIKDYFTNHQASNVSFKTLDGIKTPLNDLRIDKPFSYWKICIILTLIFVLTEMLLVRFLKL